MIERYNQVKENGRLVFHRNYCLYHYEKAIAFDCGVIRLISLELSCDPDYANVTVLFEDGSIYEWATKWITSYILQFGVAVSFDGKFIFVQTWENGLFCFDSRTGKRVWKTKSKRGITNIFVNETTILCHQHERVLQLVDIHTGEVLKEKRPATAWGFTAIDHKHIACQVTARRWEIIDTETLVSKAAFSHRDFTSGHEDYCISFIKLEGSVLIVSGFKNVWDNSSTPPKMLPNLEFEHQLIIDWGV